MKWTWIGRMFSRAGPSPPPVWPPAPRRAARDEPLLALLREVGSGPGRERAAARVKDAVDALPLSHRVRVDEMLRRAVFFHGDYGTLPWLRHPDDVRRLALPAGTEAAVLGLLASAASGYVREAAVRRLALLGGGDELPPLLLRANDWVAPVRERALDALRARLVPAYAPHWIRALRLVLRLRETGRGDNGPLVDAVLDLLRDDGVREEIRAGLHAADPVAARACLAILIAPGAGDLEDVVFRGLGSDDVVVRTEAARAAARLDDGALADLLPRMIADPFLRVRMAAMDLAERRGLAGLPELSRGLLDRSAAGRAHARALVSRAGWMDFAAFYRQAAVSGASRQAEALAGLAETGAADDVEAVLPLLADMRPRVRAAALRALARLAGGRYPDVFTTALGSPSPRVSRAAAEALRGRAGLVAEGAIAPSFGPGAPPHVRRNALGLLAWRGKWDGLAWILRALTDADPAIRGAAGGHLGRWRQRFNRTFTQPTAAQRERIADTLASAGSVLPAETVRWLRFAAGIGG